MIVDLLSDHKNFEVFLPLIFNPQTCNYRRSKNFLSGTRIRCFLKIFNTESRKICSTPTPAPVVDHLSLSRKSRKDVQSLYVLAILLLVQSFNRCNMRESENIIRLFALI